MKDIVFENLIKALSHFPTLTNKNAIKIAHFLLEKDQAYIDEFIDTLIKFKQTYNFCIHCNNLVNSSNLSCYICMDTNRHINQICVISEIEDLEKVELANAFYGTYYILKSELNAKKLNANNEINNQLIGYEKLKTTIKNFDIKEVLMCTNMTINGELTANYLVNELKKEFKNLSFYRMALGVPLNSSISFVDWKTLQFAIQNKQKI